MNKSHGNSSLQHRNLYPHNWSAITRVASKDVCTGAACRADLLVAVVNDGVEAVVVTPDVHAAERRGRSHIIIGCKAPDRAAGQRIDGVEVVVVTPDVHHLAVAAERGRSDRHHV